MRRRWRLPAVSICRWRQGPGSRPPDTRALASGTRGGRASSARPRAPRLPPRPPRDTAAAPGSANSCGLQRPNPGPWLRTSAQRPRRPRPPRPPPVARPARRPLAARRPVSARPRARRPRLQARPPAPRRPRRRPQAASASRRSGAGSSMANAPTRIARVRSVPIRSAPRRPARARLPRLRPRRPIARPAPGSPTTWLVSGAATASLRWPGAGSSPATVGTRPCSASPSASPAAARRRPIHPRQLASGSRWTASATPRHRRRPPRRHRVPGSASSSGLIPGGVSCPAVGTAICRAARAARHRATAWPAASW